MKVLLSLYALFMLTVCELRPNPFNLIANTLMKEHCKDGGCGRPAPLPKGE